MFVNSLLGAAASVAIPQLMSEVSIRSRSGGYPEYTKPTTNGNWRNKYAIVRRDSEPSHPASAMQYRPVIYLTALPSSKYWDPKTRWGKR